MPNPQNFRNIPLTSVIIPTHNCLEYLPIAVESVLSQDNDDFELIVVDDGSTDATWQWLINKQQQDNRLHSIHLTGLGPSCARNRAIAVCRGTYVAFLDADDKWHPNKLATQLALHMKRPDIILSFTDYRHVNPMGDDLGTCFAYWPHFNSFCRQATKWQTLDRLGAAFLFGENVVGTSTVMVRRDALQNAMGFDETLRSAEDWDLWLRLALMGPIGFVKHPLVTYLMRPGSESANMLLRIQVMEQLIQKYQDDIFALSWRAVARAKARLVVGKAEYFRSIQRPWKASSLHLQGWMLSPSRRVARALAADILHALRD